MRRASTSLAVLALGLLALPAVASAAPTVKFKAEGRADPGLPAHGQHPRRRRRGASRIHRSKGTEYGGFPPPLVGVNFYLPTGTKLHTTGLPDVREERARTDRPVGLPEGLGSGPDRQRARDRLVRQRTCRRDRDARILLRARRRLRVLHRRPLAGVAGNPLDRPLRQPRAAPAASAPSSITEVPLVSTVPGRAVRVGQDDQREGRLGVQEARQERSTTAACPKKCPKGGFPIKTEVIFDENGAVPIVPGAGDGDLQGAVPAQEIGH